MDNTLSSRRVLVTGGAGFIGSHIVEVLVESGFTVRVLDNFSTGKRENFEHLADGTIKPGRDFEVIEADIRDYEAVERAASGMTGILHQAALGSVPRSVEDPVTTQQVNADGTLNIFLAARNADVARVVFASSSAVYGDSQEMPRKEGSEGNPLSPYALTKRVNEDYSKLFLDLYGCETIGLRYFNVYGPRQDPDSPYAAVIPRFVSALLRGDQPVIYGTGKQTRDFTYVRDIVEANRLALEAPSSSCGRSYNVGLGGQNSLLELLDILIELLGVDIVPSFDPPRAGDVMHSSADASLAYEALRYRACTGLRDGLTASIDWYRRNI
jgi:nucleoside-diphosphate-sugar epimerase